MTRPAYSKGVHDLGDGVYAYLQPDGSWGWSNAGLVVGWGEALLVDTLFDLPRTREMLDAFAPLAPRITTVVNTHANGDHCWGNQLAAGAEIVAARACADEMGRLDPAVVAQLTANADALGPVGAFFKRCFSAFEFEGITLTPPTRVFEGSLALDVGDRRVEAIEVGPAHTHGDAIVWVPDAGVLFAGDILFIGAHPVMWAGPVGNWIAALDRILALDPRAIVPGHGPLTDRAGVEHLRRYFEHVTEEARARHAKGMTALEAARDMPMDEYPTWGEAERLVVNVATIYREIEGDTAQPDPVTSFTQMAELASGTLPQP